MITTEEAARRLIECELALRTAQRAGSPTEYRAARSAYEAAEKIVLELIQLQAQPHPPEQQLLEEARLELIRLVHRRAGAPHRSA